MPKTKGHSKFQGTALQFLAFSISFILCLSIPHAWIEKTLLSGISFSDRALNLPADWPSAFVILCVMFLPWIVAYAVARRTTKSNIIAAVLGNIAALFTLYLIDSHAMHSWDLLRSRDDSLNIFPYRLIVAICISFGVSVIVSRKREKGVADSTRKKGSGWTDPSFKDR